MSPGGDSARGRRRERSRTSGEGSAFMDVARQAFVRHVALEKWREVEDLRATLGVEPRRAVAEANLFPGRGRYHALWTARWEEHVVPAAGAGTPGDLFAAIERAVTAALADEERARGAHADRAIEEDPEYKAFIDRAMERLLSEAAGQLESP